MTHTANQAPAMRMATLLGGAGILHFGAPKFFDSMVPGFLPGDARIYTYASGVAELAVAGALVLPRTRRIGGTLAALLFVAVFPANIQMAATLLRSPKTSSAQKAISVLRLPLQVPLVTQSLAARRNAERY